MISVLCPFFLIAAIAPLFAVLAAILLRGKGYPEAAKQAGLGALGTLSWAPVATVSILVMDRLDAVWWLGGIGLVLALVLCVSGNALLATASGHPELGEARTPPLRIYATGTAIGLGGLAVAIPTIVGLLGSFRWLPDAMVVVVAVAAMAATTLAPLWIGAAGIGMALIRAFSAPRVYED